MDLKKIQELLKLVADSGVAEVEIEEDGFKLTVRTQAATVQVQPPAYFAPPMPMGYAAYPPAMPAPQAAPLAAMSPAAAPPAAAPEPAEAPPAQGHVVHAPIVGTFYAAPSPDADDYVKVGDRVSVGQVLCIIEAMKLMNEIESEVAGTVTKIMVDNGEPVEYDQGLFEIATD